MADLFNQFVSAGTDAAKKAAGDAAQGMVPGSAVAAAPVDEVPVPADEEEEVVVTPGTVGGRRSRRCRSRRQGGSRKRSRQGGSRKRRRQGGSRKRRRQGGSRKRD